MGGRILIDDLPLSPEYVPEDLVGRGYELQEMARHFLSPMLDASGSPLMVVVGRKGSGKTALLKRFGELIEAAGPASGRAIRCAYLDCWRAGGRFFKILEGASIALGAGRGSRGRSSNELLGAIGEVSSHGILPIIIMDDAEALLWAEGPDPIYILSRMGEGMGVRGFGLLLSLRDKGHLAGVDSGALSTLRRGMLALRGYSKGELREILAERARAALREGALREGSLDLIAEAASRSGDAGLAIRSLKEAAAMAEREGAGFVEVRHAERAVEEVSASPDPCIMENLSDHERLLLLAIAKALMKGGHREVAMGEAEREYGALCEGHGIAPRRHTQLWKYVRRLSIAGLLSLRASGAGFRGRTTLVGLQGLDGDKIINSLGEEMAAMGKWAR